MARGRTDWQRITLDESDKPKWMTVIGVVSHTKNYGVDQPSRVETYFPMNQWPGAAAIC